jgi:predicted  nucleic acid-binding Zn-ribbon protein
MRQLVETLLQIQKLAPTGRQVPPARRNELRELRAAVPVPVLAHLDRLVSWGRKGVALVRHGVCSECHMRVPTATVASLISPHDLYLCESCSCYLLLPTEEIPPPPAPPPPPKRNRAPQELVLT